MVVRDWSKHRACGWGYVTTVWRPDARRPEECRGILVKPGLGSAARISSGPGASKGPVKHTLILSPLKGKSGVAMMSKPMVEVKMRT